MGTMEHQRGKNKPPHRGGGDDPRKQHAPSRHGQGGAEPTSEPRRGSHHGEEQPERQPDDTEWPAQERSPSEELSSDDDRD